ncbi:CCA tRNA nucleotidyltransferase [Staphylococcus arlettae]|uniref:CCA tRNA nucleotidyltransferase n=1 Tax=Staphylococcus arlettae TaxID=29378 RepID=UPI001E467E13|nr:CCA tRNA nucleotidyltransferase [Staphylococcus arlettae]MCD8833052.1 CCA tRNA nucleotidyltransferase [Staphylococcus arlettae]
MSNLLFEQAKPILQHIKSQGYEAYFVGGSVRDYLMNKDIHDIDITTSATPDEIESIFSKTIPIGKAHGTINVLYQDEAYEITTFRTEGDYDDHRRPNDVAFVRDLYEDVKRRDFTMNAIAMDENYHVIDYFHGQQDIAERIITTVGEASERFEEDALRIIRGLRFQAQLAFHIETNTYRAMQQQMSHISFLSIERIVVELKKLVQGQHVSLSFENMKQLKAFTYIPFFQQSNMDSITITEPISFNLFIAIIQVKQSTELSLAQLKISNQEKHTIHALSQLMSEIGELQSKATLKRIVYDYDMKLLLELVTHRTLLEANQIKLPSPLIFNKATLAETAKQLPIDTRKALAVTGKDLLAHLQQPSGPWMKDILRKIELAVIQGEVSNCKTEILEWVDNNV